jgi:hypothetical protein
VLAKGRLSPAFPLLSAEISNSAPSSRATTCILIGTVPFLLAAQLLAQATTVHFFPCRRGGIGRIEVSEGWREENNKIRRYLSAQVRLVFALVFAKPKLGSRGDPYYGP